LPLIDRLSPAWQDVEPPPGLAMRTITLLEPCWRKREKPISRNEARLLWSGGLAMAGAAAAVVLIFLDQRFPLSRDVAVGHFIKIGVEIGAIQLIGGGLVSVFVLAARAARSEKRAYRPKERDRGGLE
jgi:hypothetical protein